MTAPSPRPERLPTLKVTPPESGELDSLTTSDPVAWRTAPRGSKRGVAVELALSEVTGGWGALLELHTEVDGTVWATHRDGETVADGVYRTRVFVDCGSTSTAGLTSGAHRIEMVGRIIGTDLTIRSEGVTSDLRCPPGVAATAHVGSLLRRHSKELTGLLGLSMVGLVGWVWWRRRQHGAPDPEGPGGA